MKIRKYMTMTQVIIIILVSENISLFILIDSLFRLYFSFINHSATITPVNLTPTALTLFMLMNFSLGIKEDRIRKVIKIPPVNINRKIIGNQTTVVKEYINKNTHTLIIKIAILISTGLPIHIILHIV